MSPIPALRITVESLEDAYVIRAAGEIDMDTADSLRSELDAARAARLTTLLDLSQVSFIDSSGLHVMLDAAGWVDAEGWPLFIVRPSPVVLHLLELTGTERMLPVVHAEDDGQRRGPLLLRPLHVA